MTRPDPEAFAETQAAATGAGDSAGATDPQIDDDRASSRRSAPAAGYQLGAVIGRGGMGEVVLAHDPKIGRDVALKRMRGHLPSDDATARFLREAKIQARLDHPAIVPVHEMGYDTDGQPYFTMKRLAGTTLAAKLESGVATQKQLLRALIDVCHAIELAHARGVVHRDLKPANIMLGDYGEVYVLDWGVARVIGADDGAPDIASLAAGDSATALEATQAGSLLGTPGYMPPEQARGEPVGPPADIYALGATLYEVLAGESLHPRGTGALASTLETGSRSPLARTPARPIAPELDALCVAALADDPAARPTAHELADRLQRYLDGDRDLEQRRALSAEHLATARAALASADPARRGEAVHAAGRALVLDPGAIDAGELLASLLVEPPAQLPVELEAAVAANERQSIRDRSKRAVLPFASVFLIAPFMPWGEPAALLSIIGLLGMIALMILMAWINWRVRYLPSGVFLVAHGITVIMFARLLGPFVLTPTLICGVLLALTATPWLTRRPWVLMVWITVVVMAPFALEWLGWFAPTWEVGPTGLVSHGLLFSGAHGAVSTVITANLCAILIVARYARRIASDRLAAQRELLVHAWHLKQLIPRARTRTDGGEP